MLFIEDGEEPFHFPAYTPALFRSDDIDVLYETFLKVVEAILYVLLVVFKFCINVGIVVVLCFFSCGSRAIPVWLYWFLILLGASEIGPLCSFLEDLLLVEYIQSNVLVIDEGSDLLKLKTA